MLPRPPTRPPGPNVALIIAGVVAAFGVLGLGALVVLFFIGGVAAGMMGSKPGAAPKPTAAKPALTQSYSTRNGLVVAHYPADFAAKSLDDTTLSIQRNLGDDSDEAVQVAGVANPISDDVNEFARILVNAVAKNIESYGDHWTETSRRSRRCFKDYPGLEIEGTFVAQKTTPTRIRFCFFIDSNRGYEMETIVPARHEAVELPLLQSIIDATELREPGPGKQSGAPGE